MIIINDLYLPAVHINLHTKLSDVLYYTCCWILFTVFRILYSRSVTARKYGCVFCASQCYIYICVCVYCVCISNKYIVVKSLNTFLSLCVLWLILPYILYCCTIKSDWWFSLQLSGHLLINNIPCYNIYEYIGQHFQINPFLRTLVAYTLFSFIVQLTSNYLNIKIYLHYNIIIIYKLRL